ncbi:hypothetical protein ACFYRC_31995 [Streptomyces sp. NPDC005279]
MAASRSSAPRARSTIFTAAAPELVVTARTIGALSSRRRWF